MSNVMLTKTLKLAATLTLTLVVIHVASVVAVAILRVPFGLERLNDTVMLGTIYLPLVPWRMADVPVLQSVTQMFRPPNALGWTLIIFSWVLLYAVIGYFFSILAPRFGITLRSRRTRKSGAPLN